MFVYTTTLRRGVSVMEVLMSIGIVSVGLLGVVALVPVGGHQAERGFMEDYKSLFGKSAFRQFELRAMGDPDNWVLFNLNNGSAEDIATANTVRPNNLVPDGFCLDPRFIARHDPRSGGNTVGAARFPYRRPSSSGTDYFSAATLPQPLHRMTLGSGNVTVNAPYADLLFQSHDDLRMDKPSDRTLPPVMWDAAPSTAAGDSETVPRPWQSFDDTSGLDDQALRTKRQSEGQLSWMATLVPKFESVADDLYILSVVVFENRELNSSTLDGVTERVVRINGGDFLGGGFGGGDVRLTTDSGNTTEDLVNDFNDFGAGSWVMLMRNSPQGTIYRWYKVIAADDELDNSGGRTVTLDGPDWSPANNFPTRLVIVPGVVAVYEKVVRLEGSSLFAL